MVEYEEVAYNYRPDIQQQHKLGAIFHHHVVDRICDLMAWVDLVKPHDIVWDPELSSVWLMLPNDTMLVMHHFVGAIDLIDELRDIKTHNQSHLLMIILLHLLHTPIQQLQDQLT